MSQETNQQYYQGAQPFMSTDSALPNQTFVTTFDTNLVFSQAQHLFSFVAKS